MQRQWRIRRLVRGPALALALAASLLAGCGGASAPAPPAATAPGRGAAATSPATPATRTASPAATPPSLRTRVETLHSTQPPYTGALDVPVLVWPGHGPVVAAVNGAMAAWVKVRVDRFAAQVTRDLAQSRNLPASLPPSDLTMTYRVATLNAQLLSVHFLLEPFPRGAASPAQLPAGLSFDLRSGRVYTLASLFGGGSGYLQRLASLSASGLAHFLPAGARCYLGHNPPAEAASFATWWISRNSLVLSFPAGRYTAAYCGPPTVTVAAAGLRGLLAPGGPLNPAAG